MVPYVYRLLALTVFISLMLVYDLRHPPGKRYRHREYFFLLATGVAGAVFGLLTDTITSSISPDYFILGKGLSTAADFQLEVWALGAKAGFSGWVLAGGILLVVNRGRAAIGRLFRLMALSFVYSALGATLFGLLQHELRFIQFAEWNLVLGPLSAQGFTLVWCIHLGVYVGAGAGLLLACFRVRRHEKDPSTQPPNTSQPSSRARR